MNAHPHTTNTPTGVGVLSIQSFMCLFISHRPIPSARTKIGNRIIAPRVGQPIDQID